MVSVIICEKPSVAKDFCNAFGNYTTHEGYFHAIFNSKQFYITYCFGHLLELKLFDSKNWEFDKLPLFPSKWEVTPSSGKLKQLNIIKKLINISNNIIIATDAGREGELIAREILEYTSKNIYNIYNEKNIFRFWSSEALTKDVIIRVLNNIKPYSQFDYLYFQALARQRADWLVGINLTRGYTLKNNSGLISIGRVQSPVLFEISKRTKEHFDFVPSSSFNLSFSFNDNLFLHSDIISQSKDEIDKYIDVYNKHLPLKITKIEESKDKIKHPPPLFSLTTLQKISNQKFGFSAQKTLDIAQKLYETHKLISYPRSDSEYLSVSSKQLFSECLSNLGYDELSSSIDSIPEKQIFDDNKLTDHHAIICLNKRNYNNLSDDEKLIFDLILSRMLIQFKGDYIYKSIHVEGIINDLLFSNSFTKVINPGWKISDNNTSSTENIISDINFNVGSSINGTLFNRKIDKQRPKLFTDSTILSFMEKYELGTPATRADIIEKLIKRDYIFRENNSLKSTKKGDDLAKALSFSSSKLIDYDYTKYFELTISKISSPSDLSNFETKIKKFVINELSLIKSNVIRKGLSSKQIKFLNLLIEKYKVKDIDVSKVSNDNFNEVVESIIHSNSFNCLCGEKVKESPESFYCPNCNITINKVILKKSLSVDTIKDLFMGKEVFVKGFTSKNGNKFNCSLKLKDKKITFLF